jgi:hypothetical protein
MHFVEQPFMRVQAGDATLNPARGHIFFQLGKKFLIDFH